MKYYLLDKDFLLLEPPQIKVLEIKEQPFSNEEIENILKTYNVRDCIIYTGDMLPYKLIYNSNTNMVEEPVETHEPDVKPPSNINTEVFDKDPNKRGLYTYIDKSVADKWYTSIILATFDYPLLNPNDYFGIDVYVISGNDIPQFITVDNGNIREATKYEKYIRNQYKLKNNEVVFREDIITLEDGQYIDNTTQEVITVSCPQEYIVKYWDKEKQKWIDLTTDLDRINKQYSDYEPMDRQSILEELGEDLATELKTMLKQLREMKYQMVQNKNRRSRRAISNIELPQPSDFLIQFKDKFNMIK